ncbi:divergent polysaccharide deacetylase family protein [Gilvimarinus polysaccharolyticus]|uniref:divergent polysaccharide deacetylase family protein n=1 Tax=Gilvimarinus polysaccharolyticus TaxID=863921 RepID=UPI0006732188|nr:divergent polysaccharide deacetylase family protein [Gilvimarinus polysaccharolyticus]
MSTRVSWLLARISAVAALISLTLVSQASVEPTPPPARIAIIIDDIGYNLALGRRAAELPGAYTLALLPMTPHTRELAELGQKRGKELMLHAPMANQQGLPLGPGALEVGMSRAEILQSLRASLDSLPEVVGVNNHMGSALTVQARPMGWVMGELRQRGLYFVDSRTTASTVAARVARGYGLKSAQRDVFLDHQRDPLHIQQQLARALDLAQRRGWAIAIGHPYPETLAVLEQAQALMAEQSVYLVSASALLRRAPAGRAYCPLAPKSLRDYQLPASQNSVVVTSARWWNLKV